MFTVLIAEKEHIDAIQKGNKLFFEPFLENKELAFCCWNPQGQSLMDAVPGLLRAVGRRKEWRAVIIHNSSTAPSKARNPFDAVDYSAVKALVEPNRQPEGEESWEKWEEAWQNYYSALRSEKEAVYQQALTFPFQKLTTWLCFRPEDYVHNDVQEKQDVHDWAMEMLGRDDLKPSVKMEIFERNQYKYDLRLKEQLRRDFVGDHFLNVAYPSEVHCISLRSAENNYFDPEAYWTIHQESEYSTFADRNMYFDRMRFMVFDLLPPSHCNFRTEYIRFLASALTFATNAVPGSAMQARHLYQLEVETDDAPLCTLVTSYDRKLAATYEVIENEMERIRSEIPGELTDKAAETLFCTSADIMVVLDDSCTPDKVYAEKEYGLFFDGPENELHKWNQNYRTSEAALAYIAKQQLRSIKKSVHQMHQASEISDVNVNRLTALQIEDIREYTDVAEDEMMASIPSDIEDASYYTSRLADAAENVKKVLRRRMTRKTTLILTAICLGLYLICFLPFLLSNHHTIMTVTTAIIFVGIMLAVFGAALFISLFFLRSSVLRAVRDYNNTAHEIFNDIQEAMDRFSRYLSASCNVRRGHAVQNYADKHLDEYTKSLRIRKKHQEDIRKIRAYLEEEYSDYFGDRSFCDETMSRPYEYDFEQRTEYAYPAPFLAGDNRQIEFISSGNFVAVPSSYITRMSVRMEGIYEK